MGKAVFDELIKWTILYAGTPLEPQVLTPKGFSNNPRGLGNPQETDRKVCDLDSSETIRVGTVMSKI